MRANLPENTVERLSQYRRILLNYQFLEHAFIFSHNLARILKTNPANVRRDLMLIGVAGDVHKGYDINELLASISTAIDKEEQEKIAFVGIGDMGRAVAEYFNQYNTKLVIAATFRFGKPSNQLIEGIPCYNIAEMQQVISSLGIKICVVAVPREFAREISSIIVNSGVRGILNFSSVPLQVPKHIYVEDYDIITKLEKIAYFMDLPPAP
ncbi:MAG: redox-sensing transcriptional repressor Rex [Bacteroidetes bacterium]|nr:redox-sensing transcriptional repressor Rex [Bacteroidota bacterium]